MVRGRSVGFITSAADNRTIAHELGHGVFGLEHTFPEIPQTPNIDNLMAYGTGTHLTHEQWKIMHARKPAYSWFDSEEDGSYETDGHYSTVYLVSLMLGISSAEKLAIATEAPDTKIHSNMDYELNDTWASPTHQGPTHSLTGGFHGVEELVTALKFLKTDVTNTKLLGELLHRYGDTYAHSKLDNLLPDNLTTYQLAANPQNLDAAINMWAAQAGSSIASQITSVEPWVKFINGKTSAFGSKYLLDDKMQKDDIGMTLNEYIAKVYGLDINNKSDNFKMYGNKHYTLDHFKSDKGYPDLIYIRPEWYMTYVKNLAWLLATKYQKTDLSFQDEMLFREMVRYATDQRCSLKGVIDYEIAKKLGLNEFYIPVFYSHYWKVFASSDALFNTNYLKSAQEVLKSTENYLKKQGVKYIVTEKHGDKKYNLEQGVYTLSAYKIQIIK